MKLEEWLGHEDAETTQIYVDYQPSRRDLELIERAFGSDPLGLDGGLVGELAVEDVGSSPRHVEGAGRDPIRSG